MDFTVPNIVFDEAGMCNFCRLHDRLVEDYPRGSHGEKTFSEIVEKMKRQGRNKPYDCVIGVSGGTDSTYLVYKMKQVGLRILAVNLDNGWHSEIAVHNIQKTLKRLDVDLRTYVIDWEEMRGIHLAFLRASLPWPDGATDLAIESALYRVAHEEGIRFMLVGHDFRTEGKQPTDWTYTDGRLLRHVCKRFGGINPKSFPNLTLTDFLYYGCFQRIQYIRPFWFLDYNKNEARSIIESELDWQYYGGHHYESIFTRFNITHWLPRKFNIDKRKVTFSALVRSGQMDRALALSAIQEPPVDPETEAGDIDYVTRKLEITRKEYETLLLAPPRKFTDYPSYFPLYRRGRWLAMFFFQHILSFKPMTFYET